MKTLKRIAFGGLRGFFELNEYIPRLYASEKQRFLTSDYKSFALTFSSNSCFQWNTRKCQMATYFCSIDDELILFEKPAFFEEASKNCIMKNGYLSKFYAQITKNANSHDTEIFNFNFSYGAKSVNLRKRLHMRPPEIFLLRMDVFKSHC